MECWHESSERLRSLSLPSELEDLIAQSLITTSFVVSPEGAIATPNGSSHGIGNATDKRLLGALRANAEIVLTSGLTARADNYKMPKSADLAILTRAGVTELELEPKPGQRLLILGAEVGGFAGAIENLKQMGFSRIHLEYGPSGFTSVIELVDLVVISSVTETGVEVFARAHALSPRARFYLDDLVVWAC